MAGARPEFASPYDDLVSALAGADGRLPERRSDPMLPSAMGLYLGTLMGDTSPITETDFSGDELAALVRALNRARGTKIEKPGVLSYRHFDRDWQDMYPDPFSEAAAVMSSPNRSAAMSLGMARFEDFPDGHTTISDEYDFAASPEATRSMSFGDWVSTLMQSFGAGGLGPLNVIGNMAAPRGEGRPVRINLPTGN